MTGRAHVAVSAGAFSDNAMRQQFPMSVAEVIAALSYIKQGTSPVAALKAALELREELTPRLIEELSLAPVDVDALCDRAAADRSEYWLHTMAIYLMGAYREPCAWPLLLDFFASDSDLANDIIGFSPEDHLPAILSRCYDGSDVAPLERLIEGATFDETVRYACLLSYDALVVSQQVPRERLVAFLARLLDAPPDAAPSDWYGSLACAAAQLQEPALRAPIEALFDRGLTKADPAYFSIMEKEEVGVIYADDPREIEQALLRDDYFDDLAENLGRLWYFQPIKPRPSIDAAELAWLRHRLGEFMIRTQPKVGRNAPCPCGSGKKHKKCCIDSDRILIP